MKKIFFAISLLTFFIQLPLWAKDTPIPYTLEDRDRLTRLETRLERIEARLDSMDKHFELMDQRFELMDHRFDSMDKRFELIDRRLERLESVIMWGFGLLLSSMLILVGFILWDRRSALSPTIRKNRELEEREDRIERVLKEYAAKNPEFREIWKKVAMF